MGGCRRIVLIAVVAGLAVGVAVADDASRVPLYTSEDLNRMFGPVPPRPSEPVDKSTPADWTWVEQFLDRQYARIEADRSYELNTRAVDIAADRSDAYAHGYGYYAALGLGYPMSTWWNNVHQAYSGAYGWHGYNRCSMPPHSSVDHWSGSHGNRGSHRR